MHMLKEVTALRGSAVAANTITKMIFKFEVIWPLAI